MIKKSDFNFDLPETNIAKYPLSNRDDSRLLVYRDGKSEYDSFKHIKEYLPANSLLVMNNAKVIPARLYFKRVSGATIEILLLEPYSPASYEESFNSTSACTWKCIIGNSKKWKDNEVIHLANNPETIHAKLIDRVERIVELSWSTKESFTDLLDSIGELPLPPYLNRATEANDALTYQTVFAKNAGSVAAPTAGLHFTPAVFNSISQKGIETSELTLHVGAGTFLPVKADNVEDHEMHREYFEVTLHALNQIVNNRVRVAVGTTSLRVLESLYWIGVQLANNKNSLIVTKMEPYEVTSNLSYEESMEHIKTYMKTTGIVTLQASTEIMILPHYVPRSVTALITNFHLPESTLLMLIASVVGDSWKAIYTEALQNYFRFLSYGDSSLLFLQ
jgi:S-adenosylmethionine:tRNA ribosyltransferase-isomerase